MPIRIFFSLDYIYIVLFIEMHARIQSLKWHFYSVLYVFFVVVVLFLFDFLFALPNAHEKEKILYTTRLNISKVIFDCSDMCI